MKEYFAIVLIGISLYLDKMSIRYVPLGSVFLPPQAVDLAFKLPARISAEALLLLTLMTSSRSFM
jgi:hypothetical protein